MTTTQDIDVIVLGAGPAGENVADRVARAGLSVAIVEAERAGGECSYWACMPSKALLRPVEVRAAAGRMPGVGTALLDTDAVLARRDDFTEHFDDSSQADWIGSTGALLVRGRGRLAGDRRVEVDHADGTTTALAATRAVVVATGSAPTLPPVDGIEDVGAWTNREATSAPRVPGSMIVLGGGAVGCELATAWQRLGSSVTLVQHGERLLPTMEPSAGERVLASLRDDGADVRLGTSLRAVRRDGSTVHADLDDGTTVDADEFVVAAGRRPGTSGLGLDTVGLSDGDVLAVDDTTLVTAVEGGWLHAVGDCTDRAKLTHMGKYQARACADVIVARSKGETDGLDRPYAKTTTTAERTAVTQVVFTDPQVASVGLTEAAARDAGLPVDVVSYDIGSTAGGALQADGYSGLATIVVDRERRVIVGATLVGQDVTDMLHAATVMVVGEVTLERLWHAVPSFPTMSEVWLRLLETYGL
ncbi:dihydrolipoyl dehydrogenase family protein [Actinomycetospora aeridis]|uniref:NAD(P)/FAD-dependent oxidoreductase n=1 Tax=Actinomycetospora aeridis TaxID=3129231 RepID=A0ABU8NAV3_9PSEU